MSIFEVDKGELLEAVLDRYEAYYSRTRSGWQKISCIDDVAHRHGDRNPSASINTTTGQYRCFGCDLGGDGFDLMLKLEGMKADKAVEALKVERIEVESGWLF